MAAKGFYTFEVITLENHKPSYDTVRVKATTRAEAWDELRKQIDDTPWATYETVVSICLIKMPRASRQVPELEATNV